MFMFVQYCNVYSGVGLVMFMFVQYCNVYAGVGIVMFMFVQSCNVLYRCRACHVYVCTVL